VNGTSASRSGDNREAQNAPSSSLRPIVGTLGTREDYEADVRAAEVAYAANKSSMNCEDLFAARAALRRHWPNSEVSGAGATVSENTITALHSHQQVVSGERERIKKCSTNQKTRK
jgi:hypothetical protein